jgi:protein SCO1/2
MPSTRTGPARHRGRDAGGWQRRAAVVVAVLGALLATSCAGKSPPPAPGPSIGQQEDATLPASVRDTVLLAADGQRVALATLTGEVVVISDMMTLCQETCPLDTANVVAAARDVQQAGLADKVAFLSVTIDPERDTVSRLAAYQKLYAPYPSDWYTVTGSTAGLQGLWSTLGVYIQKVPDTPPAPRDWMTGKPLTYDLTHSDEIYFLDTAGRERFILDGAPHVAAGAPVPAKIQDFMDATGKTNLAHPDATAWTLHDALGVIAWLTGHRIPESGNT